MHETLSVINEHITDMHAPRQSYNRRSSRNDAESVYSNQPGSRLSYINGHETDEEEYHLHTEAEVMAWTPARVAEYLEDQGVEKQHCEVFQEQEISGEVLLAMEQSAIFIKEFELGSVGRRLKTWQKIRALQDEVRASASPSVARSVSDYSGVGDEASDAGRKRSVSSAAGLPRIPNLMEKPSSQARTSQDGRNSVMQHPNTASTYSPLQTMTSFSARPESTVRPSAASIREMNHSRRHSSIDQGVPTIETSSPGRQSHRKQPSLDKAWTMGGAPNTTNNRRISSAHAHSVSLSSAQLDGQQARTRSSTFVASPTDLDLDRGYFSGNEVDNRNKRNVLQKRSSATPSYEHSPSITNNTARTSVHKAPGRVASTDSIREPVSPLSPAASHYYGFSKPNGTRIMSSPQMQSKSLKTYQDSASPVVTKLEYSAPSLDAIARSPTIADSDTSSVNATPPPASHNLSFFSKPRAGGMRITSEAVTQNEKAMATVPERKPSKDSPIASPTRTGSTTPSTDARSFDLQKVDVQSRASGGSSTGLAPPPATTRSRPKAKTKKDTSAYTRGLEKKTPAEQMVGCDYSGWMKKRSSNIVATWKPRLFVLRGRRLSYYYSENDKEEKGLIDISSHRVLPAESEKLTGLVASLTGASSPVSPTNAKTPTTAATDLAKNPPPSSAGDQGLFIFKLVPPRQGLSKAVNFTKPTVHYFAVNSRQEGRLWMAALMKATIDYDANNKVTTSYNQKTISLAKARERRERPPALKEEGEVREPIAELDGGVDATGNGLGIGGLVDSPTEPNAVAGAEAKEKDERPLAPQRTLSGGSLTDMAAIPLGPPFS